MNTNYIRLLIFVLIILIGYFVYVFYSNVKNNDLETEIVNTDSKEEFKVKIENKERDLLLKLKKGSHVYDLVLKLYDDIVPLTCKNFRHIAKHGINGKTYNNSNFHRVINQFMLQGGDILNGDGSGGVSLYGERFEDENFTTKHNKPYLLSMANSGPNTNGSQFFITTVETPHLDNKHVVFGEIKKGSKIINELQTVITDGNDKPIEDIKIISITEI